MICLCLKKDILYNCITEQQVENTMQCPSLIECNGKRICKKMLEKGIDCDVSDFDLEHYCQRRPVNCYFFRMSEDDATNQQAGSLQQPNRIRKFISVPNFSSEIQL